MEITLLRFMNRTILSLALRRTVVLYQRKG